MAHSNYVKRKQHRLSLGTMYGLVVVLLFYRALRSEIMCESVKFADVKQPLLQIYNDKPVLSTAFFRE